MNSQKFRVFATALTLTLFSGYAYAQAFGIPSRVQNFTVVNKLTVNGADESISVVSDTPEIMLYENDGALDEKKWIIESNASSFLVRAIWDVGVPSNTPLRFNRTGVNIDLIAFASDELTHNSVNMEPDEGNFTAIWSTGCTTSPSQVWRYYKIGNQVTLTPDQSSGKFGFNCTSNANRFRSNIAIPLELRPNAASEPVFATSIENNSTAQLGCFVIHNDGSMEALRTLNGVCDESPAWTTSSSKGVSLQSISYVLR